MDEITHFFEAVEARDTERVRAMLATHPEFARARDADGATPLHHAAYHGHRALVMLLCASGADVNARDAQHDATPSGWAIHYLRELGGLLAIEIEDMLYAIQTYDATWARRLIIRHPQLIDAADVDGKPLATYARESGDASIAALFTDTRH